MALHKELHLEMRGDLRRAAIDIAPVTSERRCASSRSKRHSCIVMSDQQVEAIRQVQVEGAEYDRRCEHRQNGVCSCGGQSDIQGAPRQSERAAAVGLRRSWPARLLVRLSGFRPWQPILMVDLLTAVATLSTCSAFLRIKESVRE